MKNMSKFPILRHLFQDPLRIIFCIRFSPIRSQCTLSLPPENIEYRKSALGRVLGVEKECIENEWVNINPLQPSVTYLYPL